MLIYQNIFSFIYILFYDIFFSGDRMRSGEFDLEDTDVINLEQVIGAINELVSWFLTRLISDQVIAFLNMKCYCQYLS